MITNISCKRLLWMMVAIFGCFQFALSQNSNDAKEITTTYYVKNAFVVQKPGTVLSNTSILIKDGMIKSVGPNIPIPFDAEVIDADSMYVYAGFIDACSHAGIAKIENKERPKVENPGNPPKKLAGITPQYTVRSAIGGKLDKSMGELRDLGFGFVHVVPRGRMLPGQGSVLSTGDIKPSESIIKENVSEFAQFRSARGMFPATTIGVMSQFRDLIKNATYSNNYKASYALNPKGLERPTQSEELAALYPVVEKKMPVFFYAPKVKDVNRALILQQELGCNMVLTGVRQGWPLMSSISESRNPVVLSLKLPEEIKDEKDEKEDEKKDDDKDVEKKDDGKVKGAGKDEKKEKPKKKKKPEKEEDPETKMLKERKKKSHDEYVSQAAMFEKQKINFSFSTLDAKSKDIRNNILRMVRGGLSENGALAALTTNPASLLGISAMAGTVEQGKIANIFITDKPYFDEKSKIKYLIIDGNVKHIKEEKKKKKKGDGEKVELAGIWSYEVEMPGQSQSGTMIIKGSGDNLEVSTDTSDEPGDFIDGTNVSLDGSELSFDIIVDGMTCSISVEFDGEAFEGTVALGEFGSFPMTGSKKPE
jgi:hypothetical protein